MSYLLYNNRKFLLVYFIFFFIKLNIALPSLKISFETKNNQPPFWKRQTSTIYSNNQTLYKDNLKNKAKEWIKQKPISFIENNGQLCSLSGEKLDFILFKVNTPGTDVYVTEQGLTYFLYNVEEEEDNDDAHYEKKNRKEKN